MRESRLFLSKYVFSKNPSPQGDRYIYKTLSHLSYLGNTGQPSGEPTNYMLPIWQKNPDSEACWSLAQDHASRKQLNWGPHPGLRRCPAPGHYWLPSPISLQLIHRAGAQQASWNGTASPALGSYPPIITAEPKLALGRCSQTFIDGMAEGGSTHVSTSHSLRGS